MTMTMEEFQALGARDPYMQQAWIEGRDKELRRLWVCICGRRLPMSGFVWKSRLQGWILDSRLKPDVTSCSYVCDTCADRNESGMIDL